MLLYYLVFLFTILSHISQNGLNCFVYFKGWIPAIKDQWSPFLSSLSSQFEPSTAKIIEAYGVTENLLLSNMAKIQMTAALFMQVLIII